MNAWRARVPPATIVAALALALSFSGNAPAGPPGASSGTPSATSLAAPAAPTIDPSARAAALALATETARLDNEARAPAVDARIAPSTKGVLGAWLLAGPFRAGKPALDTSPSGVDDASITPSLGAPLGAERETGASKKRTRALWSLVSSNDGAIDVKAALEPGAELLAYAGGVLHVEKAGKHLLLLGVDDGVRVLVDGKVVFTRDDPRAVRDDDDVIPLDLTAGDHVVVLKLHQRDGAWAFRARITDPFLAPPPGAYLKLPGTSADDARGLASKMATVSVDRGFDGLLDPPRYRPKLTVRFSEGAPRGVPVPVDAKLVRASGDPGDPLFDIQAGGVPVTSAGAGELVVALPPVAPWSGVATLETTVAGRIVRSPFPARPASEQAIARAERAIAKTPNAAPFLTEGSLDSVKYLTRRLSQLLARGDGDTEAQADEARDLDRYAAALEKGVDPFEGKTGPMRRALRSPIDGDFTEVGVYVPPWYKPNASRTWPLVVGLHGMNGYSMGVLRWMFGGDDPKKDQSWEDRHVGKVPDIDAVIITPFGHGNSLYRELGETDVMHATEWAMRTFRIDPTRVTITGMSMGGIGSAWMPLHRPHVFAGAEPLCGYHSYLIRGDVAGRALRPWERFLAEERSNVMWAENGEHLPLFIVHGTQDLPEENSGVLIERYEKLHFFVKHEHPEAGHNVWQQTYEDLKGLKWLLNRKVDLHPSHVRFKTSRTRWGTSAWVTVDELASESGWGEIDARARVKGHTITASTSGITQLTFARDGVAIDDAAFTVTIDNQKVSFDEREALVLAREGTTWKKSAPARPAAPKKQRNVTGPLRDVFYEPILFVYGAGDEARANEQVARAFAKIRYGVTVSYPVMSDAEFFAKNEPLANDRALFLVGRANKVLAALKAQAAGPLAFPIDVEDGAVVIGKERLTGRELGAAFIRPNPARPDRYVVVVAGADVPGTLRATSLPDLAPDFVVWDETLAPSRGQVLLGAGALRAGGFFTKDWALPPNVADPLARAARPRAADPDAASTP
ncbi:MAG: prolyl oligopeptidase family serine peptidase [Deltaproteobacteria bacterium]|nr:prolyl oligopeptidase family serine peptidase [Deltaproteobacteria bacterium]